MEQRRKKEEAAKTVRASASRCKRHGTEDQEEIDDREDDTPRGPNHVRLDAVDVDTDNGLEKVGGAAFGGSIEQRETARLAFEQNRLESQERMHRNMLEERKQ